MMQESIKRGQDFQCQRQVRVQSVRVEVIMTQMLPGKYRIPWITHVTVRRYATRGKLATTLEIFFTHLIHVIFGFIIVRLCAMCKNELDRWVKIRYRNC